MEAGLPHLEYCYAKMKIPAVMGFDAVLTQWGSYELTTTKLTLPDVCEI